MECAECELLLLLLLLLKRHDPKWHECREFILNIPAGLSAICSQHAGPRPVI